MRLHSILEHKRGSTQGLGSCNSQIQHAVLSTEGYTCSPRGRKSQILAHFPGLHPGSECRSFLLTNYFPNFADVSVNFLLITGDSGSEEGTGTPWSLHHRRISSECPTQAQCLHEVVLLLLNCRRPIIQRIIFSFQYSKMKWKNKNKKQFLERHTHNAMTVPLTIYCLFPGFHKKISF